ncbi:hypothetical protein J4E90_007496 [Alternaria incomplexa]|uniref:uncharacterized protein n=1 Tax=Alternaria incomplexa TaxID=1187928 RepID=UPI00221F9CF1|nr:uncharacterized protein J4E90_007496 [Alternaria incomplexa]XP_051304246.1 uncharacterized protein J4E86_004074 [Alternaria arbusti]KAI4910066.1 hypothetical protein J4E90_007496 [Alternaria incomplexa]KAI4958473.1 hypothetical protein J4E86_004074 [Alternaria arbusti]
MISLSAADFLIYSFEDTNAGEVYNAFLFLKGEPDCADVCDGDGKGGWLTETEDASDGGARCKTPKESPFGCSGGEGEILELEMNIKDGNPPYHFTIYSKPQRNSS